MLRKALHLILALAFIATFAAAATARERAPLDMASPEHQKIFAEARRIVIRESVQEAPHTQGDR